MNEKKINPIDVQSYIKKNTARKTLKDEDYLSIFYDIIVRVDNFAIGPCFYIITSYADHTTKVVSNNIADLSPFSKEEWLTQDFHHFSSAFHPDDLEYVLAADTFIRNMYLNTKESLRDNLRFNIYTRYKNRHGKYRWVLLQSWAYINEYHEIESVLYVFYDLSHFHIKSIPLLSLINFNKKEVQYYKHIEQKMKVIDVKLPVITIREKEILKLMSQGYNSPEISQELFISYHTVENHKRNLRKKTNTKTSSELIAYVMKYNLLIV